MGNKFEEATEILQKSGIIRLAKKRVGEGFMANVRGPFPLTRNGEVVGAALMLNELLAAGADPYEYYEGRRSAIYLEPGAMPEMSVRSAALPVEITKRERGGWFRVRGEVVKTAKEALEKNPAKYSWCEGLAAEVTNLR